MSKQEDTAAQDKNRKKLQLMIDITDLEAIDEWQFRHRYKTRAAAIRELIRRGIETDGEER